MRLADIDRIEIDMSVSAECQAACPGTLKGDWVSLFMTPVHETDWTPYREIDVLETVIGKAGTGYARTNFDQVGTHEVSWGQGVKAPFAKHVTVFVYDDDQGTQCVSKDGLCQVVFVNNCDHGLSSCGKGIRIDNTGNSGTAMTVNMEPDVLYRIILDNWGNLCPGAKPGGGATPGCRLEVQSLQLFKRSTNGNANFTIPSGSAEPTEQNLIV